MKAFLEEEILSDKSIVYNIILAEDNINISLNCTNKESAEYLLKSLEIDTINITCI